LGFFYGVKFLTLGLECAFSDKREGLTMNECLVVGGGVVGMLTALELANNGLNVTLVERDAVGQESSWAGGGILSPLNPWRYPPAVRQLASWSQQHFPLFFEKLHLSTEIDPEFTQNGLLIIEPNDKEPAQMWADQYQHEIHFLNAAQTLEIEPKLSKFLPSPSIWLPKVGQVRNPRLSKALKVALIEHPRVRLREKVDIIDLQMKGSQISGVKTSSNGILSADFVVICAGAWSGILLKETGFQPKIKPVRGQMLMFHAPQHFLSRIILANGHYIIPRRDGRVLAGSTMEEAGFDKSITDDARQELTAAATQIVPDLKNYPIEKHWAGLRPGSPSGIPYIGEHPFIKGLFLNTGHFRNGVVMSLGSARLLADLLLERDEPIIDPTPYMPTSRIQEKFDPKSPECQACRMCPEVQESEIQE
jgi:glycine oxidase